MSRTAIDLFRRRERVRQAVAVVERDKQQIAAAYDRFLRRKVARPATLGAFAAAGFAFRGRHSGRENAGNKGLGLSAILTGVFWVSRLIGRHTSPGRGADSAP